MVLSIEILMPLPSLFKVISKVKFFKKRSNSKVKDTDLKMLVLTEKSCHQNTHVKYQSSTFHCSSVSSKVKVYVRVTE